MSAAPYRHIEVTPLGPTFGARVDGVNIAEPVSDVEIFQHCRPLGQRGDRQLPGVIDEKRPTTLVDRWKPGEMVLCLQRVQKWNGRQTATQPTAQTDEQFFRQRQVTMGEPPLKRRRQNARRLG